MLPRMKVLVELENSLVTYRVFFRDWLQGWDGLVVTSE
jgi:hypothetical protein